MKTPGFNKFWYVFLYFEDGSRETCRFGPRGVSAWSFHKDCVETLDKKQGKYSSAMPRITSSILAYDTIG